MIKPLYCIIDHQSGQTREKQRETAIRSLELEQDKTIPIFEEATQTVASLLKVPVCTIGILLGNDYLIKSAYGLSSLGLSSQIVRTRKINREDSFAVYVVDSNSCLMIENTGIDSFFSGAILTQHYHIMSYLGVPIALNNGQCIGCLEVFDLQPRHFSPSDMDILNIVARWCLAEYEHNYSEIKQKVINNSSLEEQHELYSPSIPVSSATKPTSSAPLSNNGNRIYNQQLNIQLITKLIQKLSIPLTSVIGMSSVLKQGIYGKLNQKQQEYLNIVYNSGQEMTTLVEEITNLGNFKPEVELQLVPVDLENLGKQVISSLENAARNREHSLRLSIEPGEKVWQLDREKVKQSLYYILTAIIEGSRSGGEIAVHISQQSHSGEASPRSQTLKINCWVRHPWLGDGISFEKINTYTQTIQEAQESYRLSQGGVEPILVYNNYDYDVICLLFASYLTYLQRGSISLKGSSEAGYRFLLSLPIA